MDFGKANITSVEIDGTCFVPRADTRMRRFVLRSASTEKSWEGVRFSNGCVALNVGVAYKMHFCSWEEFSKMHIHDGQVEIGSVDWLDR